ncbi:MAG: hypothetical protein ABR526_01745 [Chthoniobacterales bacterium]
MTAEMAHAAQSNGIGIASSVAGGAAAGIGARTIGAVGGFGADVVNNGCVFVIFARVAVGALGGSGSILMRAVSCFGRLCGAEPG